MKPFHFKHFSLQQSHSSLKVGTDAMVLGALAEANCPRTILDIGTGTGVLALMMAQKFSEASITAIDIDDCSLKDCSVNFQNSPWSHRLNCLQQDIQSFDSSEKFDLIICNPPFYENTLVGENERLNQAKHATPTILATIFNKSVNLLTENGFFWVILPFETTEKWLQIASGNQLYMASKITIFSKLNLPKRTVIAFSRSLPKNQLISELILRNSDNNYSEEYIHLTLNFHNRTL